MRVKIKKNIPEDKFLPDYPYRSNFIEIDGIKIHYLEEGGENVPTILFLHGVPTWSFTFRKIFPFCFKENFRIIAPDLPGFGKSDKPANPKYYSINTLVECMAKFIFQLELKNIFLFAHDWGAIVGMILAAKYSEYFAGVITCNGYLPEINSKSSVLFRLWKLFCKYSPVLPLGRIVDFASNNSLSQAERRGYGYPFSNRNEKTAIRILPQLLPINEKDRDADLIYECWNNLENWEKPFMTVFSDNDPITKGGEKIIQSHIYGAKNQSHQIIKGKHFLQEDAPEELGKLINDFVKNNL